MIKARVREIISDPNKLIAAWKKYPMASQMFLNAPLEMKKRVANLFTDDQLNQIPEGIKDEIVKIRQGEIAELENETEPLISISCESGGKCLPQIIQKINNNNLTIKTVNMHQPKLEDVFLHFVGRAIRDESSDRSKNIKQFIQMRQLRK